MSVGAILPTEMEAWARLMKYDLTPIEVRALRSVDREFVAYANTDKKSGK